MGPRWRFRTLSALLALVLCGCAGAAPEPLRGDPELMAEALGGRAEFRSGLQQSCGELGEVDRVIQQAIAIGAPIYNAGSSLGCYRIYEGAAYKILYELGDRCPRLTALLRAGLAQAEADAAVDRSAWTLRYTFDAILGEETRTVPLDESPL